MNNVLCFPFMFRGALDVGATTINEEMKLAAVRAIANLAKLEQSDLVASAYQQAHHEFGPGYIIPTPFDPRLLTMIAPAVAPAAMSSGVATRPIADLDSYRRSLERFVYRFANIMHTVFNVARAASKTIAYAEGADPRTLRAAQAGRK